MKTFCLIHQPGLAVLLGITVFPDLNLVTSNDSNATVPLYNQC